MDKYQVKLQSTPDGAEVKVLRCTGAQNIEEEYHCSWLECWAYVQDQAGEGQDPVKMDMVGGVCSQCEEKQVRGLGCFVN